MKFSNPRTKAVVENWPSGGKRVTATFEVEAKPKKGERVSRTTTGKPKLTNYYRRLRIVDGEDGRVYLLGHTEYDQMVVIPGTLQTCIYWHFRDGEMSEKNREFLELKDLLYSCE